MNVIVVDTGPLVALFDGSDRWHSSAKNWLQSVEYPLVTNLAVITETTHMLGFNRRAAIDFFAMGE